MTRCARCNRPLKIAALYGPVCAKRAAPDERDLFGFDIDKACKAALARIHAHIRSAKWNYVRPAS